MAEQRKTVSVSCAVPNGVHLRLHEMREGPLGIRTAVMVGNSVELRPGTNAGIDAEFFAKWLAQNADSDLVRGGVVARV